MCHYFDILAFLGLSLTDLKALKDLNNLNKKPIKCVAFTDHKRDVKLQTSQEVWTF